MDTKVRCINLIWSITWVNLPFTLIDEPLDQGGNCFIRLIRQAVAIDPGNLETKRFSWILGVFMLSTYPYFHIFPLVLSRQLYYNSQV